MKPYIESFFRRPYLVIVPALLLPLAVMAALLLLPRTHSTTATLWVDRAIEETYTGGAVAAPSVEEASAFHSRLETVSFRRQVIIDAGLAEQVEQGQWPAPSRLAGWLADIGLTPLASRLGGGSLSSAEAAWTRATDAVRDAFTVEARGEHLVLVAFTSTEDSSAQALLEAATNNYLQEKANAAQRKVEETLRVHDPMVAAQEAEVEAARQVWVDFTESLPASPNAFQLQQADGLESAYRDGLARLEEMKLNRTGATLAAVTEWTNKSRSTTLVDPPAAPSPDLGPFSILVFGVLGGGVGLFIGGVLVVFRTWVDEGSLRGPEDIEVRLGMPVLAVLPAVSEKGIGTRHDW